MKPSVISAEALFESHRSTLHWEWIAGPEIAAHDARAEVFDDVREKIAFLRPPQRQPLMSSHVAWSS